jgi:penicillin-binding protein 1A
MDRRPLARACRIVVLLAALAPLLVTLLVWMVWRYGGTSSEFPEPTALEGGQVSRVFDVNGQQIGQFQQFDQNIPVKEGDIPLRLKQAVVAAEDQSFYSHGGVDPRGLARAARADILSQEIIQGGSTITQQYVRNAYTGRERTTGRKLREVVLAGRLDRMMAKDEILFKYLSTLYLGEGSYGVGAASENYFRKPVSQLNLSEAALLAGLIPAPSRYEPRGDPGAAEDKRRIVLDKMLEQGYITTEEHAEASAQTIWNAPNVVPNRPATIVYPPQQAVAKYPYFFDYLRRYLVNKYGPEAIFKGGLEINTTLDPKRQAAAEKAVSDSLSGTAPPLEMALTAVEPETGFVRAMVGGRDFFAPGGQANLALGGCSRPPERLKEKVDVSATCWDPEANAVVGGGTGRQAGSSWKPFVLAAALAEGIPETKVYSAPSTYRFKGCTGDQGCTIQNYEGSGGGSANLRSATARSINTVYAQLIGDVGVKETAEMAKKLGITSAWVATPEIQGPSYAIGTQEVAPLDMASAFGVFANQGRRAPATPVEWIEGPDGGTREDNRRRSPERVLDAGVASQVTDILKGVISGGTGTKADIGRPAAGKTGTAQEWRDAWFVGYTPQLSTAVWMGNRDRPTSLFGVKGVPRVTGGSIPAETWNAFMTEALRDVAPTDFTGAPVSAAPPVPPVMPSVPRSSPSTSSPPVSDPSQPFTSDPPPQPFGPYGPYGLPGGSEPTTTTTRRDNGIPFQRGP